MKKITISKELFGIKTNDPRFKRSKEDESAFTYDCPESLHQDVLERYLRHLMASNRTSTIPQFCTLMELLIIVESYGHNVNEMLMIATASGWSQVVFEKHLKPLKSSS